MKHLAWIVVLCAGMASAQTHTFCASDSNCAYTGNNTHTGTETFSNAVVNGGVITNAPISGSTGAFTSATVGTTVVTSGQGVWQRQGVVLYGTGPSYTYEPTVLPTADTNPQVLSAEYGAVLKMWYSNSVGIAYAESADGVNWAPYNNGATILSNVRRSFVLKSGTTYHLYGSSDDSHVDHYTSADGISWTLANASVISSTGTSNNSSGAIVGGMLYLFVEQDPQGITLYTATDFHTFTRVGPMIANSVTDAEKYQGPTIPYLINGVWYIWVGHNVSSIGAGQDTWRFERWSSSTLTGPWTKAMTADELYPETTDEGAGTLYAQVIDPAIIEFNGKTYLYYSANQGTSANHQLRQLVKVAVADMPMSSLILTNGGGNAGTDKTSPFWAWDYPTSTVDFKGYGIKNLGSTTSMPAVWTMGTLSDGYASMTNGTLSRTSGPVGLQYAGAGNLTVFSGMTYPINFNVSAAGANPPQVGFGTVPDSVSTLHIVGNQAVFKSTNSGAVSATIKLRSSSNTEGTIGTGFLEHDNYGDLWIGATRSSGSLGALHVIAGGTERLIVSGSGAGAANKAVCWKADGKTLGSCSTAVGADGSCTCN